MAISKKRSLIDMQDPEASAQDTRPQSELEDNDTYKIMVLRFEKGKTEDDVDQQFLQMAVNLGINVPQDPQTTLDIVSSNVDKLTLTSTPLESYRLPPQTSQLTIPASDSSSERQEPTTSSSITTASVSSVTSSINSVSSRSSSYGVIKQGIRRLSTLRRRRTIDTPIPDILLPMAALKALRPPSQACSVTSSTSTDPILNPTLPRNPLPSQTICFPPITQPPMPSRSSPRPPLSEEQIEETHVARQRSLHSPRLKEMRSSQKEEQSRFIRFESDQHRLMCLRQQETHKKAQATYISQQTSTEDRHVEALTSLETRHLSAEVDLHRTLQLEKQGCETRLRHMEAYCNPKSTVIGMPNRVATRKDYHQLAQQYHAHSGMDNLHSARINVLREKQGKQLERIAAKQEEELDTLYSSHNTKTQALDSTCQVEEIRLQTEFYERKKRLVARWLLAEAIERQKLENETGDVHGALPALKWPDSTGTDREEDGGEDEGERGLRDAMIAYDAATINMI